VARAGAGFGERAARRGDGDNPTPAVTIAPPFLGGTGVVRDDALDQGGAASVSVDHCRLRGCAGIHAPR
jgi:hypothetical protein